MARGGGALPPILLAPQPPQVKRFSVNVGADLVSRYVARGEAYANEPSFQPYVSVGIAVPELTNSWVKQVKLVFGNWDSLQSGSPGIGQRNFGTWKGWYESDLYGAATVTLKAGVSSSFAYYFFHSPAHSFADYGNLEWIVRYNDAPFWKDRVSLSGFALKPQLRITRDIGRPGGDNATYIQPSLTPSFNLQSGRHPLKLGIPLVFGFSDVYYHGIHGGHVSYGYFRTGVTLAKTLRKRGTQSWRVAGGVAVWFPNTKVANGLASTVAVARLGMSWDF